MKKIWMICFVVVVTLASCDSNKAPKDVTVSAAKGQRDGAMVRLTGTIEFGTGEMYQFLDSTGNIPVEIEDEIWVRSGINPAVLNFPVQAEIEGEVNKERGSNTYIDATRVRVLP